MTAKQYYRMMYRNYTQLWYADDREPPGTNPGHYSDNWINLTDQFWKDHESGNGNDMNMNMHEFYFCDTSAVTTSTITATRDIDELKRKRLLRRVGNKIDKATKRQLKVNMYSHSIHLKDTTSEDSDGDGDDTNTKIMQCFATTMDMQTARAIAGRGRTTQQNICSKAVHQYFLQPILPFVKISKDLSDLVLLRSSNGNGNNGNVNGAGDDLDQVELLLLFNNGYESLTQKANANANNANANAADSNGNEGEIMKEWVQTKLNRAVWKWNNKKKLGLETRSLFPKSISIV